MNRTRIIFCVCLLAMSGPALAAETRLSVVPSLDLGFKTTNFEFSVQGEGYSRHSYATLAPSLALGYGSFYGVASYDYTINNSHVTEAGSPANPVFESREYERSEAVFTFGYRLTKSVNLFLGILQGESDFFLMSYNTANPLAPVTSISSFTFKETGFYAGASYSHSFGDKGSLGFSAAYGRMNGQLDLNESAGKTEFFSSAPGYSLGLVWTGKVSNNVVYRTGLKYTSYLFEIDEVKVNGVNVVSAGDQFYEEKIFSLFFGLAGYF